MNSSEEEFSFSFDEDDCMDSGDEALPEGDSRIAGEDSKSYLLPKENTEASSLTSTTTWGDLHISRPLLRALVDLQWERPTIIQCSAIPPALEGRDVLGAAETGSGKTAAFLLPILERLLNSPAVKSRKMTSVGPAGGRIATKALILLPTRELASQCFSVLKSLAKYAPLTYTLIAGGLDMKSQEMTLKNQPDIVVATPGRVLDLLLNSQNVNMELLEIVVFDEADRLLDLGFKDECLAVLKQCNKGRQTLLFSATLTEGITDLAILALRRPAKVTANKPHAVVSTLQQEFVQVSKEKGSREAALLHLCTEVYMKRVIVFFQKKVDAHKMALLFCRFNLPNAELHGNLNQAQRLANLDKFVKGEVEYLLASELAARGLDIDGVQTVINFQLPWDVARYVHRVGRTARMGRTGSAVTLFTAEEKSMVKKLAKASKSADSKASRTYETTSRVIPQQRIQFLREKIAKEEKFVKREVDQDKLEKELQNVDKTLASFDELKDLNARDLLAKQNERSWHVSGREKHLISKAAKNEALVSREAFVSKKQARLKRKGADLSCEEKNEEEIEYKMEEGNHEGKKKIKNSRSKQSSSHKGAVGKKLSRKEREINSEKMKIKRVAKGLKNAAKASKMRMTDESVAADKSKPFGAALKKETKKKKRKAKVAAGKKSQTKWARGSTPTRRQSRPSKSKKNTKVNKGGVKTIGKGKKARRR